MCKSHLNRFVREAGASQSVRSQAGAWERVELLSIALLAMFTLGCGESLDPVEPPAFDTADIVNDAAAEHDKNDDQKLSAVELQAAPGLRAAVGEWDKDGDKALSSAEIERGVTRLKQDDVGLMQFQCTVTLDGKPLEGARVEFTPAPGFDEAIVAAEGTTNRRGRALIAIPPDRMPVGGPGVKGTMQPGVYRVHITHPRRKLPARFNSNTELGQVVSISTARRENVTFAISSR